MDTFIYLFIYLFLFACLFSFSSPYSCLFKGEISHVAS